MSVTLKPVKTPRPKHRVVKGSAEPAGSVELSVRGESSFQAAEKNTRMAVRTRTRRAPPMKLRDLDVWPCKLSEEGRAQRDQADCGRMAVFVAVAVTREAVRKSEKQP